MESQTSSGAGQDSVRALVPEKSVPPRKPSIAAAARFHLSRSLTWMLTFALVCAVGMSLQIWLPIGAYYWEVIVYQDAAWRIAAGQIPHVDFSTNAGIVNVYLVFILQKIFPGANIVLLVQWGIPLLIAPLLAIVLAPMHTSHPWRAAAILAPFFVFASLPFNSSQIYPLAGIDAFGFENRHTALLLYVVLSAVLFAPRARAQIIALFACLVLLFFTKFTGFIAGMVIVALGVGARRVSFHSGSMILMLLSVSATLLLLFSTLFSAYLQTLTSPALSGVTDYFPAAGKYPPAMIATAVSLLVLVIILGWYERATFISAIKPASTTLRRYHLARACDLPAAWLFVMLGIALFLQHQSAGMELVFLWPVFVMLLLVYWSKPFPMGTAIAVLVAFICIPVLSGFAGRTLHLASASLTYEKLQAPALGSAALVRSHASQMKHARTMNNHFAYTAHSHAAIARIGVKPSYLLYAEPDFHLSWLYSARNAMDALAHWQRNKSSRIESVLTLDMVDPFNAALKSKPVRLTNVGITFGRLGGQLTLPQLIEARKAHIILQPLCPMTPVRLKLAKLYKQALAGRKREKLTNCWDIYVRKEPPTPMAPDIDRGFPTSVAKNIK